MGKTLGGICLLFAACGRTNPTIASSDATWNSAEILVVRTAGRQAFAKGAYKQAAEIFSRGAEQAIQAADLTSAGRFLADRGGAILAMGEHQEALRALLRARKTAESAGDISTVQSVEGNLVSLYGMVGDTEAAYVAAMRGSALRPANQGYRQRIEFLILFGRAVARIRGIDSARTMFSEALELAAGDWPYQAAVLEMWGHEHRRAGDLESAEEFLIRAWRARVLGKDRRIPQTENLLAAVFRERGRIAEARFWHNRAAAGQSGPSIEWARLTEDALLFEAEGHEEEALTAFRAALESARRWREQVPESDRIRLAAELSLNHTFDGYLRVAARRWRKRESRALGAEMFAALQNHRAWSLRDPRRTASSEPLLETARRLEEAWLGGNTGARVQLASVRAAILENESSAPGQRPAADVEWLEPGPGEAVLSFWSHEEGSLVWLWSAGGLRTAAIAPRRELLQLAATFRQAVAAGEPAADAAGRQLFDALLGPLREFALQFPSWDIVADETLSLIPYAALRITPEQYLVERVRTRLIPNTWGAADKPRASARFLGFADPIFNFADERRISRAGSLAPSAHWAYQLPRLPATRVEADTAARAWRGAGFEAEVRSGADCNAETMLALLRNGNPEIVHIGTHTAAPAGEGARPRLALSLRADGSPGLLTAEDIGSIRCQASLVIMSACHSAGSEAARGAGWIGLTRAWLSAGSRQVISTLWPIREDSSFFYGKLHGEMARNPGARRDAGLALRSAQLACLREGGARAKPDYWAAHFLLARR